MSFEILYKDDLIIAGNSVRNGDVDAGPYDGFSVCGYTGDSEAHTGACRDELAEFMGVERHHIVQCRQTHSTDVYVVESVDGMTEMPYGYDAIVTRLKNVVIGVNTADCVSLAMFDKKAGVIGVAHAGWRGALAGVAVNTVKKMVELGASPENIHAFFGPSILECCFEVGEEVAELFPGAFVKRSYGERPHVDLPGFVKSQIDGMGVKNCNIKLNCNCTRCRPDIYFSARAVGIESGRNFTFIMRR